MMSLIEKGVRVQEEIQKNFEEAYRALQYANITMGVNEVEELSMSLKKEEGFDILFKKRYGSRNTIYKI